MGWWKNLISRLKKKPKPKETRQYMYTPREDEGLAETRMLTNDELKELDKAVHDMSEDHHWNNLD